MNKKNLILATFLLLSSLSLVFAKLKHPNKGQKINNYRSIVDESGKPSKPLRKLLDLFEIKHNNTLPSIVKETQQIFKRPDGKERWQLDELFPEKKEQARTLLKEIGCIDEIYPSKTHYDYVVLLGATLPTIRKRLTHVIDLWYKGIYFDNVIFLGGQRPLDNEREPSTLLINDPDFIRKDWELIGELPKTEIGMMRMVYEQAQMPIDLQITPVSFIDTPMQQNNDGTMRRPNTSDTVRQWLKEDKSLKNKKSPSILVISSQPHIGYQDTVMRTLLPKHFVVDSAGPTDNDRLTLAEILDAIARWLYQEQERRKLLHTN